MRYWATILVAVAVSGCSLLSSAPPQTVYRLPAATIAAYHGSKINTSLCVMAPKANGALGRSRILVAPDEQQISAYPDVRWNTFMPVLVRDYVLEAFINDGRISQLSSEEDLLRPDVLLGGALRAFQVEYHASMPPQATVCFDARLVDPVTRKIIASRRFMARDAVRGEAMDEIVASFGRAANTVAQELVNWTVVNIPSPNLSK
ncbi:MAG: membrane integrity-associated transporter subunit PqiC [Deltaproteobacteria bacterium]|nr:membrane integrity-associated transporter subunit PqiC [Deltaproteobacteria bacterium]